MAQDIIRSTEHQKQIHGALRLLQSPHTHTDGVRALRHIAHRTRHDTHAWWLLAQATPHPHEARAALRRILYLKPGHRRAQAKLADLDAQTRQPLPKSLPRPTDEALLDGDRVQVHCQSCGADVASLARKSLSACPFCGGQALRRVPFAADALARYIIPFSVTRDEALTIAQNWLAEQSFVPAALRLDPNLLNFRAVYLPYWMIDADISGTGGSDEQPLNLQIRDMLYPATSYLTRFLTHDVADFIITEAQPYRGDIVGGAMVHQADVLYPELILDDVRLEMLPIIRTQHGLPPHAPLAPIFRNDHWEIAMLPAYIGTFRYGPRTYQVMVNGQTGHISGERPIDWPRVLWLTALVLGPGAILVLLAGQYLPAGYEVFSFLPVGILLAGGLLGALLLREALTYDEI